MWPLTVVGLLTIGFLVAVPSSNRLAAQTSGHGPESTACPTMTDSINRLYMAYFNRAPEGAEFRDSGNRYRSGQANLEVLSAELALSDEFRTRYGTLDDERFVELVYRNVLRRDPEPADRDFWIANLEAQYPRGSMMIAFSESEEFVQRTGTATPLSGFLRWYPPGVHWYCGVGPRVELSIRPLDAPTLFSDFMFHNSDDSQGPIGLKTMLNDRPHVTMAEGSLPGGFTEYKWGGLFEGDGNYGSALSVQVGPGTSWIAVFYPTSIGEQRLGWQLDS
ncbi:MAG: DUF4214 domain-containing protein [Acidimicrobiales bacterium]